MDNEKAIKVLENCVQNGGCINCEYSKHGACKTFLMIDVIFLLKERRDEYEKGFNDAMQGKRELMYEGTDGKWHKKDW